MKKIQLKDLNILSIGHTIQMAGAVYTGEGKAFLCVFPEEGVEGLDLHLLEMSKDDWTAFFRQTDFLETEIITNSSDEKLARTIVRKSQRQIDQKVAWAVYRRDGFMCRYCGCDRCALTVDHLVTWEEGGPTVEDNLFAVCAPCNRARGSLPYAQWLEHPHYRRVSSGLSHQVKMANAAVKDELAYIPRQIHKRSR